MEHLTHRTPKEAKHINLHEDEESQYWVQTLGVTREELQQAINKVGNNAAAVRQYLQSLQSAQMRATSDDNNSRGERI